MSRQAVAVLALAVLLLHAATQPAHACSGVCDMRPEVGYFLATEVFIGHRVPSERPIVGERVQMDGMVVDFRWKGSHSGDGPLRMRYNSLLVSSWSPAYQPPRELVFARCDADGNCATVAAGCAEYSQGLGGPTLAHDVVASWPLVGVGWAVETMVGLAVLIVVAAWIVLMWRRARQRPNPVWLKVLGGSPLVLVPAWSLLMVSLFRCPASWYDREIGARTCPECVSRIAPHQPLRP